MIFYLLSPAEVAEVFDRLGYRFDPVKDLRRTVDYYLARTSHGSTLSRVVHAWVLGRLDRHRSWELFLQALESDVADVQGGTTHEGVHLGAMAGTVDLVQRGYAGIATRDGVLWLDPALPDELPSLGFLHPLPGPPRGGGRRSRPAAGERPASTRARDQRGPSDRGGHARRRRRQGVGAGLSWSSVSCRRVDRA